MRLGTKKTAVTKQINTKSCIAAIHELFILFCVNLHMVTEWNAQCNQNCQHLQTLSHEPFKFGIDHRRGRDARSGALRSSQGVITK